MHRPEVHVAPPVQSVSAMHAWRQMSALQAPLTSMSAGVPSGAQSASPVQERPRCAAK